MTNQKRKPLIKVIHHESGWIASAGHKRGQRSTTAPGSREQAIDNCKHNISILDGEILDDDDVEICDAPDIFRECSKCKSVAKEVGEVVSGPWYVNYLCGSSASWDGQKVITN